MLMSNFDETTKVCKEKDKNGKKVEKSRTAIITTKERRLSCDDR